MLDILKIKKEIVYYCKLMYKKGYIVGTEGNISYRLSSNEILITKSNILKEKITDDDIIIIDSDGNPINSNELPSTERFTHLEIYKQRDDINVIIHAHPIYTIIQTLDNPNFFQQIWLPEARMFLRNPKILPKAMPSTKEGAEVIKGQCHNTNIIIIQEHGSFIYSTTLYEAFNLLEILEKYCMIDYLYNLKEKKVY